MKSKEEKNVPQEGKQIPIPTSISKKIEDGESTYEFITDKETYESEIELKQDKINLLEAVNK